MYLPSLYALLYEIFDNRCLLVLIVNKKYSPEILLVFDLSPPMAYDRVRYTIPYGSGTERRGAERTVNHSA